VLRHAKKGNSALKLWAQRLLAKKPFKVVAVALTLTFATGANLVN
jgi:hypothetical protein